MREGAGGCVLMLSQRRGGQEDWLYEAMRDGACLMGEGRGARVIGSE